MIMADSETIAWDPALVDWAAVAAGVAEQRAECEMRISQVRSEIRAAGRNPRLAEQEQMAAVQDNIDACDELLDMIDADP